MARTFAQIYLTIWNDPDFKALTSAAQHLYFVMLTHPTLTSCGVMDWRENRLLAFCADWDSDTLRQAAWELGQARLIAVDPDTEEGLVRSFVRHDGVLKSPNLTKAMVREHAGIASPRIAELVSREVRRAIEMEPNLKGSSLAEPVAKQFPEPIQKGFEWVPDWFKNGSCLVPQNGGQKTGKGSKSVPVSLNPHPLTLTNVSGDASNEAAPRETSKRGTRITEDWMPSQSVIDTIRSEHPDLDLGHEHAQFIDYWLAAPGQRGVKLDWDATWRKWMRKTGKEQDQRAQRVNAPPLSRSDQMYLAELQRLRAEENQPNQPAQIGPTP